MWVTVKYRYLNLLKIHYIAFNFVIYSNRGKEHFGLSNNKISSAHSEKIVRNKFYTDFDFICIVACNLPIICYEREIINYQIKHLIVSCVLLCAVSVEEVAGVA
jgi:uncharacterized membrane protein